MDLANVASASGGSVACPVCTLYLREGISLQKHLDTHPKEQVIEALIKVSVQGSPPTPQVLPTQPVGNTQNLPQQPLNACAQIPQQSQYPVGPIFECPPMNPMMPPQFASFSYQQFVNNGTMMIPQYAMAPQTNQMMQMLYNPYSMYQQQQIPTVQMISPIATIPTTRIRPVTAVPSDVGRGVLEQQQQQSTGEPKIYEEMPPTEAESELILEPEVEISSSSLSSTEEENALSTRQAAEETRLEDATRPSRSETSEHRRAPEESLTKSCDPEDSEKPQDGCSREETRTSDTQVQCKVIEFEEEEEEEEEEDEEEQEDEVATTSREFAQDYQVGKKREEIPETMVQEEEDEERSEPVAKNETSESTEKETEEVRTKETNAQPEVEQLEKLLITIMETSFEASSRVDNADAVTNAEKSERNEDDDDSSRNDVAECSEMKAKTVEEVEDEEDERTSKLESQLPEKPSNTESIDELRCNGVQSVYRYRCSTSAPSSPQATSRKLRRTCSLRSFYGSSENVALYPSGFEAGLHERDEDVSKRMEDNLNEEDMEIEEIASPHTPFPKHNNGLERSHTPLSAISGISGLRLQRDVTKERASPSEKSYCPMDLGSSSDDDEEEEEEDDEDDDDDDEVDDEEDEDEDECNDSPESSKSLVDRIEEEEEETTKNPCGTGPLRESQRSKIESYSESVVTEHVSSFSTLNSQQPILIHESYSITSSKSLHSNVLTLGTEMADPTTSGSESKGVNFQTSKSIQQQQQQQQHIQSTELLNISEDAHAGPMNVFEFDGIQILIPSTYISESSQKAISATSQQSVVSSEGGAGIDEEVKSVNMRADETMPPRGELSEQESNGCNDHSEWQMYVGQESSRMSTSYDLMARESWEESEGSENEADVPLLDSRSLATHFTSSLFLDRDRKTPTRRTFKCSLCTEVFDCPKERRVHSASVHKEEAGPSGSNNDPVNLSETKDMSLLEARANVFDDIFVSGLHVQQPLLHQLQPPQQPENPKVEVEQKLDSLAIPQSLEISCAMCSQRFSSERSLQVHNRRVHGTEVARRLQEISKCQICNEEFPSVMLFNAHLKIHPLECAQCGKYFYRKPNFNLHMKRHLGIKPFPCTVCDKAFLTKQKLDEHTNGHTGNAPVKCNLCNETFRRYSNLTQHKNRHHLNLKRKLKDYICHCGEVFHTKKKLAWHKETHDEKPKACTYCNERFIHMSSLTRHMRRAHNRRFVPDARRESENVECPVCKCIYLRSSLSVHMRVHNGERPYECQVCSKTFSTKWNLQLHKWTHAARSTKPFKCNQCSAAFYRHSDYTAHMNSHRNVRPYTCNYCGAQFIRKYNCLRHVKEHEESKAYTCDVCNKTFHRSYYLKEHLRVHSGARPYSCHICGKSSSTKSNHNKHVRIHHAREPVNTEN